MRFKNGTGTIRQKNATTWEGRYYFGGKRKSVYGKTEREVRIKLNELYATVLKGTHIEETGGNLRVVGVALVSRICGANDTL